MDTRKLYEPYYDEKLKDFSNSLTPDSTLKHFGISIPHLDKIAKTLSSDNINEIIFHEDVILKGFAIAYEKIPFKEKAKKLNSLIPYLSSWDQTDTIQARFKVKEKEKDEMFEYFSSLLKRDEIYAKRLGIVWLFSKRKYFTRSLLLSLITSQDSSEYYISMAIAWALSAFYKDSKEDTLLALESVSEGTKKRALQKIRDSKSTT